MKDQFQRRAWALLIVLGSFVAAAAVWTLPEDAENHRSDHTFGNGRATKI